MGAVFRPWVTRYIDASGKQVAKGTPGAAKVKGRTAKWYGQYTNAAGVRRRVPLSTDKRAAQQMLAKLEREAEQGKAGLADPSAGHRKARIDDHVNAFLVHVGNKGVTADYLAEMGREITALLEHGRMRTLDDLTAGEVERLLAKLRDRGTGPTTRNHYLGSIKQFVRWCLSTGRLTHDPLAAVAPASRATRRKRRALSAAELTRLLAAARERPLAQAETFQRGPRKGQRGAVVHPETRAELERLGWERSLIYRTLVHTGLRRGELEALEVRHLTLDGPRPHVFLPGAETKNGEDASIPLRADLVEELRRWLGATGKGGTDRVFRVVESLVNALKKDLAWAGIPYKDAQGRQVDVHSLRHTTGTFLAKAKVAPQAAQRHMRHKDIKLTMQTYADASHIDEAEALAALPELPGDPGPKDEGKTA